MNEVKVIEDEGNRGSRPYRVMVNGTILLNRRGSHRRFETSFAALAAGTKDADLDSRRPLFIPLKGEYYDQFECGEKDTEYRPYGQRWNERTCPPGREVVLSRGYGKARRLRGTVAHFTKSEVVTRTSVWRSIYGTKYQYAACICIRLAPVEAAEVPVGMCPSPINGKTTVTECIAAGQCGCDERTHAVQTESR